MIAPARRPPRLTREKPLDMSASDEEEIISQIIGITGLDPIEHRDIVRAAYKVCLVPGAAHPQTTADQRSQSHSGSGDSVINEYYNNEDPTSVGIPCHKPRRSSSHALVHHQILVGMG